MQELSNLAIFSLSLYLLTALLLIWSTRLGPTFHGRLIAHAAMLVSGAAIYTMFLTYQGKTKLVLERPGPMEKRPLERRSSRLSCERRGT